MSRDIDLSMLKGICDDYALQGIETLKERFDLLVHYDLVTGLPNRTLFISRLEDALKASKQNGSSGAIFAVDIDDFRKLSDTYGYLVGDELLRIAGEKLQEALGSDITLARMGGDEFFVLVRRITDMGDISPFIKSILSVFNTIWHVFKHEFYVTASIGITVFPDDGGEVLDVLRNAATALYKAKDLGKNQYQFYESGINEKLLRRYELENGLRHALERDEIRVFYQPQVDVPGDRLTGFEALIRWDHPRYGLIPPDDFIPVAEDTGLIIPIGNWVIGKVCAQMAAWEKEGFSGFRTAVNISAKQLRQKGFIAFVRDKIESSGVEPSRLELEITESSFVKSMTSAVYMLGQFRQMGITISIDDFGTGYSSLSYLKNLPCDRIKIDKSFIRGIGENETTEAIIEAVVLLAKRMHMEIIAEGVETVAQRDFLVRIGCSSMQGYLHGKPLKVESVRERFFPR